MNFYALVAGVGKSIDWSELMKTIISNCLPSSVIDIRFELSTDVAWNTVAEPQVTDHQVISFLAEVQLSLVA